MAKSKVPPLIACTHVSALLQRLLSHLRNIGLVQIGDPEVRCPTYERALREN
jgi:hypothetical protein